MSKAVQYNPYRLQKWLEHRDGWDQLVSQEWEQRKEANWPRASDKPSWRVTQPLRDGLECLCAGQDEHGETLLRRAVRNADRLISEDRLHDTEIADIDYPRPLGEIVQGRAYAKWLLDEPLDRDTIRKAAEHLVTWCLTKPDDHKRFISNVTMDYYLTGVRCALIAFDIPYASELVSTKQRFLFHHLNEKQLWARFVERYPRFDDEFRDEFEKFFDRVRDPEFKDESGTKDAMIYVRHEWLALDMGIIRQMYLLNASPLDPVDPQVVIDAVAY